MIKLRPHQASVTPACIKSWRKFPKENGVVALPTASGKTYAIADLIKYCVDKWHIEVLVLTHVKEIIEQNEESIIKYVGHEYNIAVNSASVGRREKGQITIAGIQSVYNRPDEFRAVKLVIIDEAHLLSEEEDTMYRKFLSAVGEPTVVGFTATPYRLGDGYIYGKDKFFKHLIVDWTTREKYNQLVKDGWLCKLVPKETELQLDTSDIHLKGGEFDNKELSMEFDRYAVSNEAIKEIMHYGKDRKKWMIFTIDINHANHVAEILIMNGVRTCVVHSQMKQLGFDRSKAIEGFKGDIYDCVVNVNVLTTGFDHTGIDLIAMLRPTKSPTLYVQSLGRGSRIQKDKENCLILDFAGNTARLGPINDVVVITAGKGKGGGDAITKTCPECNSILAPSTRKCPDCGYKFQFKHGISVEAANNVIIEEGKFKWLNVEEVIYERVVGYGTPSKIKVTYIAGNNHVVEWVNLEHQGFAKEKADHWVKYRGGERCNTCEEFLNQKDNIAVPDQILVGKKGKYSYISEASFTE